MPPRRQPTLLPTGPEEPAASAEDPQDINLDIEIENLRRQVEEKRKYSQIAAFHAELAGKGCKRGLSRPSWPVPAFVACPDLCGLSRPTWPVPTFVVCPGLCGLSRP